MQDRRRTYGDDVEIASIEQPAIVGAREGNGILAGGLLQLSFVDIGDRKQPGAAPQGVAGHGVLFKNSSRTDNSDSQSTHVVPSDEQIRHLRRSKRSHVSAFCVWMARQHR